MLKVSRDEIQRDSPKIPAPVKNSGDLAILENSIGSCNTITKVILSALSTGLHLTGAGRFENSHRNERPSSTTVSFVIFFVFVLVLFLFLVPCSSLSPSLRQLSANTTSQPPFSCP